MLAIVVNPRQTTGRYLAGASVLLSILLAGCGLAGEGATMAFVAPGKFDFYNCAQLEESGQGLQKREQELQELMQRAAQSPGGEFVGAVAYRTELLQMRGQLKLIAETSAQKNCTSQSKRQSERALW